jgi:hypothetical protein
VPHPAETMLLRWFADLDEPFDFPHVADVYTCRKR